MTGAADIAKRRNARDDFGALLLALDADDRENAGRRYLLLRKNLVRFFEARGFLAAEEASEEVLDRLAKKLGAGNEIENPQTYALGIARFVALEFRRSPIEKTSNELPELRVDERSVERNKKEKKLECLDSCLLTLAPDKRELIVGYYEGEKSAKIENRKRLAERLRIKPYTLRNRALRLREKLENCITNCLKNE